MHTCEQKKKSRKSLKKLMIYRRYIVDFADISVINRQHIIEFFFFEKMAMMCDNGFLSSNNKMIKIGWRTLLVSLQVHQLIVAIHSFSRRWVLHMW